MSKFEVWTEGYRTTDEHSKAMNHGTFGGKTFKDAVRAFRDSLTDQESRDCIDLERMTFWGCSFFDNEVEARKGFG